MVLAAVAGGVSAVGAVATAEQFPGEGRLSGLALGTTTATAIFGGLTPWLAQLLVERNRLAGDAGRDDRGGGARGAAGAVGNERDPASQRRSVICLSIRQAKENFPPCQTNPWPSALQVKGDAAPRGDRRARRGGQTGRCEEGACRCGRCRCGAGVHDLTASSFDAQLPALLRENTEDGRSFGWPIPN